MSLISGKFVGLVRSGFQLSQVHNMMRCIHGGGMLMNDDVGTHLAQLG